MGEKTAAELLRRRGSLEAAIENAVRERPPRLSGALLNQADELRMFKDLATLRTEKVKRPRNRKLDLAGGAAAARRTRDESSRRAPREGRHRLVSGL